VKEEGLMILHLEEHQIKAQLYLRFNPITQFNSLLPILKIKVDPVGNSPS